MYEQLETLGVMAELKGLEYPAGVIKGGWDIILLNQFHDIIPGSAIGPVYEQTDREYEEILKSGAETALHLAEGMGSRICGQDKDTRREEPEEQKPEEQKIIVFNTQGYEREDTVTVSGVARGGGICLRLPGTQGSGPVCGRGYAYISRKGDSFLRLCCVQPCGGRG